MKSNKLTYISFVKTMAVICILNSHMGNLYPSTIFSIGGSIGNTLFFLCSGYLLSSKVNKRLLFWIKDRILRIYPSVWLVTVLFICIGHYHISGIDDLLYRLFFPYYSLWFVTAIMVSYTLIWLVKRVFSYVSWLLFFTAVYIIWYAFFLDTTTWSIEGASFFKYCYYFIIMLIGCILKEKESEIPVVSTRKLFIATFLSGVFYLISRGAVAFIPAVIRLQFIVQIATCLFGISFFLLSAKVDPVFSKVPVLTSVMNRIGNSTLEIYLLNYFVIDLAGRFIFPLNIIFAFIVAIAAGVLTHEIVDKLHTCHKQNVSLV